MDNVSVFMDDNILFLEGLQVSERSSAPVFLVLLLLYMHIMASNGLLVLLIVTEHSLHTPMHLLLLNLSASDTVGATTIVPRLLADLLVPSGERSIGYAACAAQAFCLHLYAGTSHTVLMVMAFDRYLAICAPLRYAALMTPRTVLQLSAAAWASAGALVATLLGLSVRLTRCRRHILHPVCDNPSLFKLSCESLLVNQVYGLAMSVLVLGASVGSVTLTYLRIAAVCLANRSRDLRSRALQTCSTHLAVYAILLVACLAGLVLHRFPQWADYGKIFSVVASVVPPALNCAIYGLQSKDIRQKMTRRLHSSKVALWGS